VRSVAGFFEPDDEPLEPESDFFDSPEPEPDDPDPEPDPDESELFEPDDEPLEPESDDFDSEDDDESLPEPFESRPLESRLPLERFDELRLSVL
jgi:hypothetical protein